MNPPVQQGPPPGLPWVAIVDFGGQYTHLIAKKIRKLGVYSHILAPDALHPAREPHLVGIILSGSPHSTAVASPSGLSTGLPFDPLAVQVPVLGICYGHQLLARLAGGRVETMSRGEYGLATIHGVAGAALLHGLPGTQRVWMSHRDSVVHLPAGFRVTASTADHAVAAFESDNQRVFGLQFHPEVVHSEHGEAILQRFLSICTPLRGWRPGSYRQQAVARVRRAAGDDRLFLLISK